MKIAQVTYNSLDNYGSILQKYALQKILRKFTDFAEYLWFHEKTFWVEDGVISSLSPFIRANVLPQYHSRWFLYEAVRTSKFKEFDERYIKTRFNLPYIEEIADEYDFFIMGSDQVWNPILPFTIPPTLKFLPFVPREKKIAYAVSIGNPIIPEEHKNYYFQGIAGFEYISVREEGAVRFIEELGLKKPKLVLDPVMLLTRDEWAEIARKPSWFNEKYSRGYILTYYLRKEPPSEIKSVAEKSKLPVINLLDFNNFNHYTIGPEDFLWLMMNASLIYTNSFHGTAFSILFRRPFIDLEYNNELAKTMSLRIPSLLKMFGLKDRTAIVGNYIIDNPLEIDWSVRDKILPYERAKSFKFLTDALSSKIPEINLNGGDTEL